MALGGPDPALDALLDAQSGGDLADLIAAQDARDASLQDVDLWYSLRHSPYFPALTLGVAALGVLLLIPSSGGRR